jgi:hypothetical protein
MKYHFVILANENPTDHLFWIKACEKYPDEIKFSVNNFTGNNWLNEILQLPTDFLLAKPGGTVGIFKQLYDERLQILVNELGYKVYPSFKEIQIYENKGYLSYWLSSHSIPHPKTDVFYNKHEALEFIQSIVFPIVAKLNIGASGHGVKILKNKQEAERYIKSIFHKGLIAKIGPRFDIGDIWERAFHKMMHLSELKSKISVYKSIKNNPQKGFCLFQEFVPHTFEWRVVRIGDSYFAHQKVLKGEKASGSLIKKYINPPTSLLDFVHDLTEKAGFRSQAVDLFETGKDRYLVNEMQCIFGQSDPYQMLVNNTPGRYIYSDKNWVFEEGMFNTNESYDLRIQDILQLLKRNQK